MNWTNTFWLFFVFPIIFECNSWVLLICQSVDPSATGNGMEIHHGLSQTQYNTTGHAKNGQSNAKTVWYYNWTLKFDTHNSNHSNQCWFAGKSQFISSMNFPFCLSPQKVGGFQVPWGKFDRRMVGTKPVMMLEPEKPCGTSKWWWPI